MRKKVWRREKEERKKGRIIKEKERKKENYESNIPLLTVKTEDSKQRVIRRDEWER